MRWPLASLTTRDQKSEFAARMSPDLVVKVKVETYFEMQGGYHVLLRDVVLILGLLEDIASGPSFPASRKRSSPIIFLLERPGETWEALGCDGVLDELDGARRADLCRASRLPQIVMSGLFDILRWRAPAGRPDDRVPASDKFDSQIYATDGSRQGSRFLH